jgi:hypothetical protein
MATASNDQHLDDLFQRAAAVAAKLPESLQEAAFHRALDALMGVGNTSKSRSSRKKSDGAEQRRGEETETALDSDPVAALLNMPRSRAEQVDDEDGALGKALALLHVAEEELGIEGLTGPQIAQVLTTKFKWKVSRQAITQALDKAGKMVDSKAGPGARVYIVMDAGIKYLDSDPEERRTASAPPSRRSRTTRRPTKSGPAKAAESDSGAEPDKGSQMKARRSSSRPGPTQATEALIDSGFFKTGRTLGDIRVELRDTRGLSYRSSDLSPIMTRLLRDGKLTRRRNDDSQYEYISE